MKKALILVGSGIFILITIVAGLVKSKVTGLIAAIILYLNAPAWLGVSPLTMSEALHEFSSWDSNERVAVFSSLLAMMGALIGFQTANWANERVHRRRVMQDAADEFHSFFSEAHRELLELSNLARRLIHLNELVRTNCNIEDVRVTMLIIRSTIDGALTARRSIAARLVRVHSIRDKYTLLFAAFPLAGWAADRAIQSLQKCCDGMHFVTPDLSLGETANLIFVGVCNVSDWEPFVQNVERHSSTMMMMSGMVRGRVMSGVFQVGPFYWVDSARTAYNTWRSDRREKG